MRIEQEATESKVQQLLVLRTDKFLGIRIHPMAGDPVL